MKDMYCNTVPGFLPSLLRYFQCPLAYRRYSGSARSSDGSAEAWFQKAEAPVLQNTGLPPVYKLPWLPDTVLKRSGSPTSSSDIPHKDTDYWLLCLVLKAGHIPGPLLKADLQGAGI